MMPNTYVEALQSWLAAMTEAWDVKLVAGAVITFFANWFGEDSWLVAVLFGMVALDTALGMLSALKLSGQLSGKRLHQGMVKFGAYAAAIVLVWLVQEITLKVVPIELPVLSAFAAYQALTEISSVVRHLDRLGIKMPALLLRILDAGKGKVDEKLNNVLGKKEE